jgi:hypothetical protein
VSASGAWNKVPANLVDDIASVQHVASHVVPVEPAARKTAFGWLLLGANLIFAVCQFCEAVSFRCLRGCG